MAGIVVKARFPERLMIQIVATNIFRYLFRGAARSWIRNIGSAAPALSSMTLLLLLSGVVGLEIARDGRWSVARYLLEAQAISLGLVLVSIVRDLADFHFTILGWMFVVGLGAVLAFTVGVYVLFLRLTSGRDVQMGANS